MKTVSNYIENGDSPLLNALAEGRAYTLTEISKKIKKDKKELKDALEKMIDSVIVSTRGDHRRTYYFIEEPTAVRLRRLLGITPAGNRKSIPKGIKYSRHCYKHLAGYAGVKVREALEQKGFISESEENGYNVTTSGWRWFSSLGINKNDFKNPNRLTKQCLDFSERKNHLGGHLGDALLEKMLANKWVSQVPDSREIKFTATGKRKLKEYLDLEV